MNRPAASTWLHAVASLGVAWLATSPPARAQDAAAEEPAKPEAESTVPKSLEYQVTKALEAVDLTPPPAFEVPDPPPHEGAMIEHPPYVLEPPDLIIVEVLDALEGRPITGERLVRPDGTITLGFYGEVNVRGLTVDQARIKIIKQLRTYLTDEILGLTTEPIDPIDGTPEAQDEVHAIPVPPDDLPPREVPPAQVHPQAAPAPTAHRRIRTVADGPADRPLRRWRVQSGASTYFARSSPGVEDPSAAQESAAPPAEEASKPTPVVLKARGNVTIRIEIESGEGPEAFAPTEGKPVPSRDLGPVLVVTPELGRDRVFVDVTAYNSKNYHVLGWVNAAGKLPSTGNETVLDAIDYAGGLHASADPDHIDLVRPGRNGKPPRVYKVDLVAIQTKGETATNYQLFPGDRLYVHPRPAPAEEDGSGSK